MNFLITKRFTKSLEKLDSKLQNRIKERLKRITKSENPLIYADKLSGKDLFKFRVGTYRIIFRLECDNLILMLIKHRKEVYKNL